MNEDDGSSTPEITYELAPADQEGDVEQKPSFVTDEGWPLLKKLFQSADHEDTTVGRRAE